MVTLKGRLLVLVGVYLQPTLNRSSHTQMLVQINIGLTGISEVHLEVNACVDIEHMSETTG